MYASCIIIITDLRVNRLINTVIDDKRVNKNGIRTTAGSIGCNNNE